jgi:hypothetical protein
MTVIRPNSISGITSLTAHRGSIDFYAHDGSAARFDNINSNVTSGVSTFASLNITGDLDVGGALTYEDVTNIDSVGIITARAGINISGGNLQVGGTNVINSGRVLYNLEQIKLADAKELVLGSGNDLKIQHSGSHSFISQEGVGALKIKGDDIRFEDAGGTEALRLDSAGRLLLGTTTVGPSTADDLTIATTGNTGISIRSGTSSSGNIFFSDGTSGGDQTRGVIQYDHAGNYMRVYTDNAERVRITDAGMVGINMTPSTTGNSTYMLQMYNAGSQCFMSLGQGSGNGPLNGLVMGVSNAAHYITGRENSPMIFATNDSERMRLDTSGRLLLNSGTDVRIELGTTGSTGTNNRNHLRGDGANMKYNCCSGGGHFFEANGGERMRISSNGHVNIGDGYIVSNSGLHVGRSSGGTAAGESVLAATLGNDSTMVSALLTVKNAGNRGSAGHSSGSPLAKFEFNNGTAFEIDKNGYRTLPYQPCAMAYNAQGQYMGGGSVAEFNSTRFNIGNMYNSSNGRMTVPVAGRYLVAYSGLHDYISQSAVGFDVRINGSNFNGGEAYQESNDISNSQLSKTLILSLSANDYVDIYIRSSGTRVHQRYGSFSMCLLT